VVTTWDTTVPPRAATAAADVASWLAWRAESADWLTVLVSASIEAAVCCRLDAVCSVRADKSWLPAAISDEAIVMESTELRISPAILPQRQLHAAQRGHQAVVTFAGVQTR
jgi:hypothetical protein